MGRTKRIRNRRKPLNSPTDFSAELINLAKYMKKFGWKNVSKLKVKIFENSGRGLTSSKNLQSGDILIEAPLKLMITLKTLLHSEDFMKILRPGHKFKIQDLLVLFLVFERGKLESEWKFYLESLPEVEVELPWFNSDFTDFPEDLHRKCAELLENFLESWRRLENLFRTEQLEFKDFLWGYTMVNTRAVYIESKYLDNCDLLMDAPNLALFPLMDMFNHADDAENSVEIRGETFLIRTLKNQRKNRQIHISYGRHDNLKLFTEYGFYLQKNLNDKLSFKFEDILKVLNLKLDNFQYDFLKKHEFLDELFINYSGVSFKLKGFLYVALNNDVKNYNYIIFSGNFGDEFTGKVRIYSGKLIDWKILQLKNDEIRCKSGAVGGFLESRVRFSEDLRKIVDEFT